MITISVSGTDNGSLMYKCDLSNSYHDKSTIKLLDKNFLITHVCIESTSVYRFTLKEINYD